MTPTESQAFAALRESHRELMDACERAERAFLSDSPHGPQKSIVGDDTIYHLDGGILGNALDKVRAALATARRLTEGAKG